MLSHPHDDHYGGIKQLFESHLALAATTTPTAERPLIFNGPFLTSAAQTADDWTSTFLGGFGFTSAPGAALAGFDIEAGGRTFARTVAPAPPGARLLRGQLG
jgi:hypothetical protein